jgi:hypothetical protein
MSKWWITGRVVVGSDAKEFACGVKDVEKADEWTGGRGKNVPPARMTPNPFPPSAATRLSSS